MTTHTTSRPARAPGFVRVPGPLVSRIIGLGLWSGPNVLLTIRGRRSGRPLTIPLALVEHEGRRFVQSPFGEVSWVHNLRAAGEATITKGTRHEVVAAREVPLAEAGPLLRAILTPYLRAPLLGFVTRRYFGIGPDASDPAFIEKARHQPLFELTPKPSAP